MSNITEKILEYLQLQAENTIDLVDTLLSDRGTASKKYHRFLRHGAPQFRTNWAEQYRERQRYYSLLNHLRRSGLIENKRTGKLSLWKITKAGVEHFKKISERRDKNFSLPRKKYQCEAGKEIIILSYDIPERQRGKRYWLRSCLISLEFQMLQKSVWIGKIALPAEFIKDLRNYKIFPFVHIFSINQAGTIKEKYKI